VLAGAFGHQFPGLREHWAPPSRCLPGPLVLWTIPFESIPGLLSSITRFFLQCRLQRPSPPSLCLFQTPTTSLFRIFSFCLSIELPAAPLGCIQYRIPVQSWRELLLPPPNPRQNFWSFLREYYPQRGSCRSLSLCQSSKRSFPLPEGISLATGSYTASFLAVFGGRSVFISILFPSLPRGL